VNVKIKTYMSTYNTMQTPIGRHCIGLL